MNFTSKRQKAGLVLVAVAVVLLIVSIAEPGFKRSLLDSIAAIRLFKAGTRGSDTGDYRYASGLRRLSDVQAGSILWRIIGSSTNGSTCSPAEKDLARRGVFQKTQGVEAASGYLWPLLAIRQTECAGETAELPKGVTTILTHSKTEVLKTQLYLRQGRTDEAVTTALPYLCPISASWCKWCATSSIRREQVAAEQAGSSSSPESSSNPGGSDTVAFASATNRPLFWRETQNLTKARVEPMITTSGAPFVVADAVPTSEGDNYLEFNRVPVRNPLVRFRVTGAVLGSNKSSCVAPRLVFWSSGNYLGETRELQQVEDRFEIDLWTQTPQRATTVTPRLTFDHDCFQGGQTIVICSAEFADVPGERKPQQ
jgi:hypothetical protein